MDLVLPLNNPRQVSLLTTDPSLFPLSPAPDLLLVDEVCDTTSDLMLAQMLQMQFDREFDDQLRREERKFNGDNKGRFASRQNRGAPTNTEHTNRVLTLCSRVVFSVHLL